jgi:aminoglycoside 6'-N-acetyltransferase
METAGIEARITLRNATPADAPLLRHWDDQPHVIASDPNDDWHWETELAYEPDWREQLVAELTAGPSASSKSLTRPGRSPTIGATCRPTSAPSISGLAKPGFGQGYGTVMMRLALGRCFADPSVTAVLIDPLETNRRAHPFYERMGFRFVEKRTFNEDPCLVYRLDRPDWEASASGRTN